VSEGGRELVKSPLLPVGYMLWARE